MKPYAKLPARGSILLGMLLLYPAMLLAAEKKITFKKLAVTNVVATNVESKTVGSTNVMSTTVVSTPAASDKKPVRPPPGTELFPLQFNGEVVVPLGNYWDGVDDDNNLHVMVSTFPVLNDVGGMAETMFTPSVNFVDMNNDGLNDLVVGDTYGFLWIFFNSGQKGKPLFTIGTIIPTFLGWASKIHVADWDGDGDKDIVIGGFFGDFAVLPNVGSANKPKFTRSMGIPRYISPLYSADDPAERLAQVKLGKIPFVQGIYMSPWLADWNKDSKPDLLFGDGTYSANSVRVAMNQGSRGRPTFLEDRVFYLAYGEGFEQLTPSVVDYNGDGVPDLMCGTRTGQIRLHQGTDKPVEGADIVSTLKGTKAPAGLEFDKYLPIAGKDVFSTMSNPFPCDWNEDGLFDIVMGSTRGIFYIALNQGTKSEPAFPAVEPIKGANVDKDLIAPAGWWNGIGHSSSWSGWGWMGGDHVGDYCNSVVLLSAEKEVELKKGLPAVKPVQGEYFMYFRYGTNYIGWNRSIRSGGGGVPGARVIASSFALPPLEIGKKYEFKFSSILVGASVLVQLYGGEWFEGNDLVPPHTEARTVEDFIVPTATWQEKTMTFVCPGKQTGHEIAFGLGFGLPPHDSTFCLDAFSLKELPPQQ